MSQEKLIKRFVRDTLGCTCPEEVFRQIELIRAPEGTDGIAAKIIIGGRLLIHVVDIDSSPSLDLSVERLLRDGRAERDSSGLNRFRLVLLATDPTSITPALMREFESLRGTDEKVHLHVIARGDKSLSFLLK